MAFVVLPCLNPFLLEPKATEIDVEPVGQIIAFAFHEFYLLVGDDEILQIAHLFHHKVGKAFGIDKVVTVVEHVFDLCTWVVVNDGTAHRELVQVVVSKMVDYLSHEV